MCVVNVLVVRPMNILVHFTANLVMMVDLVVWTFILIVAIIVNVMTLFTIILILSVFASFYSFSWKKGDIALWSNRSMLHAATAFNGDRKMFRITIQ